MPVRQCQQCFEKCLMQQVFCQMPVATKRIQIQVKFFLIKTVKF